jgi:hypothetical protein
LEMAQHGRHQRHESRYPIFDTNKSGERLKSEWRHE